MNKIRKQEIFNKNKIDKNNKVPNENNKVPNENKKGILLFNITDIIIFNYIKSHFFICTRFLYKIKAKI